MKEHKKETCDPCEQDFKHKVNELVREGKAPSHMEREKREHEVKAAFRGHQPAQEQKTSPQTHKPMGKPEAHKEHAMAGASKMKK